MKIVATQARQHHRHSELMLYSDWYCSQVQKPTPNRVPALRPSQYQARKRAPARSAMPSIGLGKPKADACSLFMMLPHATTGFRLQPGVKLGSSSSLNLSIVITQAASSPAAPV